MAECDEIVTGLYLGNYNAACDKNLLDSLGITHILTVASDLKPQFLDSFTYKRIRALDMPSENLYGSFQEAIEFITQGLSQGHVLVHCLYGISRSSTIVVAYLMQTMNIKLDEALEITTSKRPCADPNSGFARQLRKFESDLFNTSLPYSCRNCRSELFTIDELEEHTSQNSKKFSKKKSYSDEICTSIFVTKMEWMGPCDQNSGKIECQYCLSKLGDYNWAGRQCSCGKFVTPAFQIHRSAVDGYTKFDNYVSRPKNLA